MPKPQIKTKTALKFKQKIIQIALKFVICKQKRWAVHNFAILKRFCNLQNA